MASEEQLGILRQGPEVWNAWRQNEPWQGFAPNPHTSGWVEDGAMRSCLEAVHLTSGGQSGLPPTRASSSTNTRNGRASAVAGW